MTAPGFLAIGGVEVANNARTLAYLQAGLGGPQFEAVTGSPCPDLQTEAFPLNVCASGPSEDQFFSSPIQSYRMVRTGLAPAAAEASWLEAGYWGFGALATQQGLLLPNPGTVPLRVRLAIDNIGLSGATRQLSIGRVANAGTAAAAWIGGGISITAGGVWAINVEIRPFGGGSGTLGGNSSIPSPPLGQRVWLEVIFSTTGLVVNLYGADPDGGQLPFGSFTYSYSTSTLFVGSTTQSEFDVMSVLTEVGIVSVGTLPALAQAAYDEIDVQPNYPCPSDVGADLYPSDTLWPSDTVYPGMYGVFVDPGLDNAPWIDVDRPEGYGFLGLLIDRIDGLDSTSTRSMDQSADGIGGILGPETLDPRDITVTGWLIANGCTAMEFARRWLEDTLAGSLCAGCRSNFIDVRTTCGDRPPGGNFYTNRWRIYDVGVTNFTTDLTGGDACCFYTPVTFKLGAADPFLYGPVTNVVAPTVLNPGGADAPLVSFETWLFGQGTQVCTTVIDQGIGIDAPIFTFYGGSSGIEAGLAFQSMGLYPSDSIFPGDCIIPADGTTQQTNDDCAFAFSLSLGPGETFVVDNSRRKLTWTLVDGTVLDGSPRLNLAAGSSIEWIDSCFGVSVDACAVAFAGCTCDDTATVQIQTQHRER